MRPPIPIKVPPVISGPDLTWGKPPVG